MEQSVEHGPIGPPLRIRRSIAIKAVLADIEVEGAEVVVGEVAQRPDIIVEVVIVDRLAKPRV